MNDSRDYFTKRREPAAIQALQSWSAHGAQDVALGLAQASETPGDWRVSTLTWLYSRDDTKIPVVAYRLSLVAALAAANSGIAATPELIAAAVGDAMLLVRNRKAPVTIACRAIELGIRKKTYCDIRGQAEASLRRAIAWALNAYLRTCDFRWAGDPLSIRRKLENDIDTLARAA